MLKRKIRENKDRIIKLNDTVIAYVNPFQKKPVFIEENNEFFDISTGRYCPKKWEGKPYGSSVYPDKVTEKTQPLFLLKPTPELWTKVLHHRTQILYMVDISMICFMLELEPGSIVLESGTGSASASHSFIRAIAPTGQLYTFDFHINRVEKALEDFNKNNLMEYVTVKHHNIEKHGFPEEFKNKADAVFLDLPMPWKAIESAYESLKDGGNLCTFSPCMEQIQKTMDVICKLSFICVKVMECLEEEIIHVKRNLKKVPLTLTLTESKVIDNEDKTKEINTYSVSEMKGHTGYLIFAKKISSRKLNTIIKTSSNKGEEDGEEMSSEIEERESEIEEEQDM